MIITSRARTTTITATFHGCCSINVTLLTSVVATTDLRSMPSRWASPQRFCTPASPRSSERAWRDHLRSSLVPPRVLSHPTPAMRDQPAPDADREREDTRKRESPDLAGGVPAGLSAREAARLLGVHERTIRRAIRDGELTATKQDGSFHITAEDLERYRERRARPVRQRSGTGPQTLPVSP